MYAFERVDSKGRSSLLSGGKPSLKNGNWVTDTFSSSRRSFRPGPGLSGPEAAQARRFCACIVALWQPRSLLIWRLLSYCFLVVVVVVVVCFVVFYMLFFANYVIVAPYTTHAFLLHILSKNSTT